MFSTPDSASTLENCCFYSSVPAEAVTVAIVDYTLFHSLYCLMHRKAKYLLNSVETVDCFTISEVTQVFEVLSFSLDTDPQSFCQSFSALFCYYIVKLDV